MDRKLYDILLKWLKEANYKIDFEKFEINLLSHPDYGSLTSITETLNQMGIENTAAQIDFKVLENLTEPFISFIKYEYQEQFALIELQANNEIKIYLGDKQTVIISSAEFEKVWTGTIVAIEKEKKQRKIWLTPYFSLFSFSIIALILLIIFNSTNQIFYSFLTFSLAIIGLFISGLIVNHQLGYSIGIASKFCKLGKNTDCESVLNSKAAKLNESIGLSDIGVVYFASQILILLFLNSYSQAVNIVIFSVSVLAIPFIIYSIYLQKFVIKKWCPLCLGVVTILFIQAIFAVIALLNLNSLNVSLKIFCFIIPIIVLVTLLWYLLIPILKSAKSNKELSILSMSFRRNYHLLIPYLQNKNSISPLQNVKTIQIANESGNTKLIVVTNPLCNSCIKTHTVLKKLAEKYDDLSIELILYVPLNMHDPRMIIASHFLNNTNVISRNIINEWYSNTNQQSFIKKFGNKISDANIQQLKQQKDWCHKNYIFTTPNLIINGKVFPNFYNPTDIQYFIEELLNTSDNEFIKEDSNLVLVDNT